ncbi:MAG: transposase [Acidobacteriia bacterium]|nr:transposase [Terriglobia bacterium]
MMGFEDAPQEKLFYVNVSLDKRVRANHPLRQVARAIDFDFIYKEVHDCYGTNGHVSVPPPIILKLMLLLVFYNVRSERELMDTVPERLDWLWFLGYDLDSEIPDHSVLSKAPKRWGVEVFQRFFERIVCQCVEAGLVDGRKVFLDSSLIEAHASKSSVIDTHSLQAQLHEKYAELEARLEEIAEERSARPDYRTVNQQLRSTTDPDAAVVRRGKPKLAYQVHRAANLRGQVGTLDNFSIEQTMTQSSLRFLTSSHHPSSIGVVPGMSICPKSRSDPAILDQSRLRDGAVNALAASLEMADPDVEARVAAFEALGAVGHRAIENRSVQSQLDLSRPLTFRENAEGQVSAICI